jgi:hypothetical protein
MYVLVTQMSLYSVNPSEAELGIAPPLTEGAISSHNSLKTFVELNANELHSRRAPVAGEL